MIRRQNMAEIKYFGSLRTLCGRNEDRIAAENLTELLEVIKRQYGKEAKKAAKSALIVVDREKVLSIRKTALHENSKVDFYPA